METFSIEWEQNGHLRVEYEGGVRSYGANATTTSLEVAFAGQKRLTWVLVATISFQCFAVMPVAIALT